eukprot:TRINITY_DN4097_c0_g1_i1.p1 TRINITY_DN4097_c0_g1~~TRINITY_DN4097_c0_g1_i1.p1  ORF type:complete len:250 (-),score=43.52 TRINITY_DN4097_c0_g1_i1:163-870(-)
MRQTVLKSQPPSLWPHILGFVFTLFILYLTCVRSPILSVPFFWHPTLMTLGFVLIGSQSILVMKTREGLFSFGNSESRLKRNDAVRLHFLLHTLSIVLVTIAIVIIYYGKEANNKPHFATWHGLLGVIVYVLAMIQYVFALPLVFPVLRVVDQETFQHFLTTFLELHKLCGYYVWSAGIGTVIVGLFSTWFIAEIGENVWIQYLLIGQLVALIWFVAGENLLALFWSRKSNSRAE